MSKEETPDETLELQLQLQCQNCSRSLVRCLNHFPGVEEVITEVKNHKVIVKGKGIDSKSIGDMFKEKCSKHVDIISPKIEEPVVITEDEVKVVNLVLDVYIHCQNCGNKFRERLLKMKGVEKVEVDEEKSQVKVEGVFESDNVVEYVKRKMGKQVIAVTTFMAEEVTETPVRSPKPKKKQGRKQKAAAADDDDDGPKMTYTTYNHNSELFRPHEYDGLFHGCQFLSDEYSQSCSIM